MTTSEQIKAYVSTLSRRERIQFMLDMQFVDAQVGLDQDLQQTYKELITDFFTPRDSAGNIDAGELKNRIGEYLMIRAGQAAAVGDKMEPEINKAPEGLTPAQKSAGAGARISNTIEGYTAQKTYDFMYQDAIEGGLIPDEAIEAMLKSSGKKPQPGATVENKEKFKDLLDEGYVNAIEEEKKRLNMGDGLSLDRGKNYPPKKADLNTEEARRFASAKVAAEYDILGTAREKQDKINKAARIGGMKLANDVLYRPKVLKAAYTVLSETGKGGDGKEGTWWHKNNSPEYNAVINSIDTYEKLIEKGKASPDRIESARQVLIADGLKYIDGKEKVRSSEFGRQRFDAVMNALHTTMDKADFQALCDKINKKRGLTGKPDDENYLSERKFAIKASMASRSTTLTEEMEEKLQNVEEQYGPVSKEGEISIDLAALYAPSGKQITDKQFAALVYGYALTPEAAKQSVTDPKLNDEENANLQRSAYAEDLYSNKENFVAEAHKPTIQYSKEKVTAALLSYREGDKKPLADILAGAIHEYAGISRSEGLSEKWAMQVDQKQVLLDFLAKDKDLEKLAKEKYKEMGSRAENKKADWNLDLRAVKSSVEVGKLVGKASQAEKELRSGKSLSEAKKVALYADILKVKYLQSRIMLKNRQESAQKSKILEGETKISQEKGLDALQRDAKYKALYQAHYGNCQSMENLINPKDRGLEVLDAAAKRSVTDGKITKLSVDQAISKLSDQDFLKDHMRENVLQGQDEVKHMAEANERAKKWKPGREMELKKPDEEIKPLLPM